MYFSKRNTSYVLQIVFSSVLAVALLTGCGDSSTNPNPSGEVDIQLSSTSSHGEVLTDGDGYALYLFSPDVKGESVCEGNCIANWSAFHSEELNLGEGLDASNFGTITRPDGSNQTTFMGWPLYYYVGDEQAGVINGDGLGDAWYVTKADYSLMIASQQLVGNDGANYRVDDSGNYVEGDAMTNHIVDIQGRTLYIFAFDSANTNNYTEEDFSNNDAWPIAHIDIGALPSGINATHLGEITVHDERQQLTYKGWPLYYFGQDEMQRGNTKGVSVPEPGIWPVAQAGMEPAPGYTGDNNSNTNEPGY